MDSTKIIQYRRAAIASAAIGLVVLIFGIVEYSNHHPNRGLAGVVIGVIGLVVGIALVIAARGPTRGRPRPW